MPRHIPPSGLPPGGWQYSPETGYYTSRYSGGEGWNWDMENNQYTTAPVGGSVYDDSSLRFGPQTANRGNMTPGIGPSAMDIWMDQRLAQLADFGSNADFWIEAMQEQYPTGNEGLIDYNQRRYWMNLGYNDYQQWLGEMAAEGYFEKDPYGGSGYQPTDKFWVEKQGWAKNARTGQMYNPRGNWSDEQWNTILAASGARYLAPTYENLTNAGYRVDRPQSAYAPISSAPTVTPTVTGNSSADKVYAQQSIARRQQQPQPQQYRPRPLIGGY